MNRRDFIQRAAATGGGFALPRTQLARAVGSNTPPSRTLRVLILGGTGFIGPHVVRAAADRGHKVSVFNRGTSIADLPERVERLTGDRNGDLQSITGRDWDAVLDLATYVPNWVRTVGAALRGRVNHYTFISTLQAYESPGSNENSKLARYTGKIDPYTATSLDKLHDQYGALKVLCEQEAEQHFPGKTLIARPGNIVGPRELVGAFTYWVARMEKGGEVLTAGNPLTQVQLVDVRDLAEWTIRLVEQHKTGAFNVVGPALPLGWAEMLGAIRGCFSVPTKLTWVSDAWLKDQDIKPQNAPLFWPSEFGIPGMWKFPNDKARTTGLTFRPLNVTVADTFAWYKTLPGERQKEYLLAFSEKKKSLEDAIDHEAKLLTAWHAQRG